MNIHHLAIRVKNLEESLKFYQNVAGLQVMERFTEGPAELAYMADHEGASEIELICIPDGETASASGMFICFGTDDLEAVHKIATEENRNPSPIREPSPTAKYFYVYDPDGLSVQFREYK